MSMTDVPGYVCGSEMATGFRQEESKPLMYTMKVAGAICARAAGGFV